MNVLLAFVPFLTFALLERGVGTHGALLAATVVSALLVVRDTMIRHKSLKLLEAGSLVLFAALTLASRFPKFQLSVIGVRLWVDAGLLAMVAGSLLIGRPFTLQYARERVSPEIAAGRRFKTVNIMLSAAWAAAFAVIVAADAGMLLVAGFTPVVGTIVIVAALAAAALFTAWLPKAARRTAQ
ncbi:MAG: hypothetical protein ACREV7_17160 [Steroidobacteraceae bacterium]